MNANKESIVFNPLKQLPIDAGIQFPFWEHQLEAIQSASAKDGFMFAMDMGTGKTATAAYLLIQSLRYHKDSLGLIVAPGVTMPNWKRELSTLLPVMKKQVAIIDGGKNGSSEKKLGQVAASIALHRRVYIVSHETLALPVWKTIAKLLGPFLSLIIDESQRFKNPTAKRTKAAFEIAKHAKFRWLLTGTPTLQSPLDLFAQFYIIDPKIFGGNYYTFRARFFEDANERWKGKQNYFPKWKIRPSAEKEIAAIISSYSFQKKKSECLDLPPLFKIRVEAELTEELVAHYREMSKEFVTYYDANNAVTADLAITKSLRLQQICNGILSFEDQTSKTLHTAKLDVLRELLESVADAKVIIWTCWKSTYPQISELLESMNLSYVFLTGNESGAEKEENIQAFQTDRRVQVCVANQQAAGVGVNLQAASYSIYYAKNFNLEHDLQSEARNYRGGSEQHEKVTRYDIVTKGTVEELIDLALKGKMSSAELLLEMVKHFREGTTCK